MKEILDKIIDIIYIGVEKLNKISEKIEEQTKIKINFVLVLGAIFGIIFLAIFVKAILGFLWGQL